MKLTKGDKVYYARIIPNLGIYEVYELIVRTVTDTWFVGIDKRDKHAFLINNSKINETVFENRKDALEKVRSVENDSIQKEFTKYYEEY